MTRHIANAHRDESPAAQTSGPDFEAIYGNTVPVAHPWAGLVFERA